MREERLYKGVWLNNLRVAVAFSKPVFDLDHVLELVIKNENSNLTNSGEKSTSAS